MPAPHVARMACFVSSVCNNSSTALICHSDRMNRALLFGSSGKGGRPQTWCFASLVASSHGCKFELFVSQSSQRMNDIRTFFVHPEREGGPPAIFNPAVTEEGQPSSWSLSNRS